MRHIKFPKTLDFHIKCRKATKLFCIEVVTTILPNKGLLVLGTTAFVLAVLPFAISTRKNG